MATHHGSDPTTVVKEEVGHTQTGWLTVSIDGFGEQQRCRPLGHLVKELVQNGMDAIDAAGGKGHILLTTSNVTPNSMTLTCEDSGNGIENLAQINTVFSTSKHDTVTARGRMGQGFKEILSIARSATVVSRDKRFVFATQDDGTQTVSEVTNEPYHDGLIVTMDIEHDECELPLYPYFSRFIVKPGMELSVEGQRVESRTPTLEFQARLPTEIHDGTRWRNRTEEATVSLVPTRPDSVGYVCEMGIPVCPVGWEQAFDVDISQRIPLNPNRNAVKNNFDKKVRSVCFPPLLDHFDADEMTADWVAEAALESGDQELMQKVVETTFGANIALGKAASGDADDDNDDARYEGFTVVDTSNFSGHRAKLLRKTTPTVREVTNNLESKRRTETDAQAISLEIVISVFLSTTDPSSLPGTLEGEWDLTDRDDDNPALMETVQLIRAIGADLVVEHLTFAKWLSAKIRGIDEDTQNISAAVGVGYHAKWLGDGTLILSLSDPANWTPLSDQFLTTIIHEVSHSASMNHGRIFHREVEKNAGRAASIMLREDLSALRDRFPNVMQSIPEVEVAPRLEDNPVETSPQQIEQQEEPAKSAKRGWLSALAKSAKAQLRPTNH